MVDAHVGGVGDLGHPVARYHVEGCDHYERYRRDLLGRLHREHGDSLIVYRAAMPDEWSSWGAGVYLSTTTSLTIAEAWSGLACVESPRVVVSLQVPVVAVIFEAANEKELVIDSMFASSPSFVAEGGAPCPLT